MKILNQYKLQLEWEMLLTQLELQVDQRLSLDSKPMIPLFFLAMEKEQSLPLKNISLKLL